MNESTDRDAEERRDEPRSDDARPPEQPEDERTVEIPAHEEELKRLRDERDQLEQKLQRAMADTQNMRRRQQQELADGRRRTLEGLTQELLPVLDSFKLALQAYDQDAETHEDVENGGDRRHAGHHVDALVEGVRMVQTLLSGALERHGLQEIPSTGPFDPARHEALGVEPSDAVEDNHIVRVVQTGYMLGDRVVRHSKVIVAGGKPGGADQGNKDA